MKDLNLFLQESQYIDFSHPDIQVLASDLFANAKDDIEKSQIAYEFVRDEIPHSFDINAGVITAKASDVLQHKTGICHAKANLLAALLRSQNIPTGFCYQHITLLEDDSLGYCVHCYNAIYLDGKWIKVDARGNKPGANAQFSMNEPILSFPCRAEYDEYFWDGMFSQPQLSTMLMLEKAKSLQDILDNIPDEILMPYSLSMQSDIDAFYDECFSSLGWGYEPGGRHSDCVNIPDVYQKKGQFWCLYDGDKLIGTVAIRSIDEDGKIAELKRLYVTPSRQGEGFGKLLFEAALKYAKDAGYDKICADTRLDRSASQHLMKSHSFKEIPQYNDNNFAELFFELDLK